MAGGAEQLLAAGDEGHARVAALLDGPADEVPLAALQLIPRFGRPDDVGPLARLLREGGERTAWYAGQALGVHGAPAAFDALVAALAADRPETLAGALGGVLARGDAAACPHVEPLLAHPDATVRERARATGDGLGCASA
jgi:HEAT repeat protein